MSEKKKSIEQFRLEREKLNEIVLKNAGTTTKRFFNLDTKAYNDGALDSKTKEMMGLTASLVLRCDDCITYHAIRCYELGVTTEELEETASIGLVVGGSIVIPHLRRLYRTWEELKEKNEKE